ncbi:L-serine ammonia-lyase, iron-sulfur-dependent, subunit alpha [Candidatus Neomarinimicrobiota bacterium]
MAYIPSIINDVLGPVMRGPSASHTAAAYRIGLIARALMGNKIDSLIIRFDENGALATTHSSQGSDQGLFAGLLGWDITDSRLNEVKTAISNDTVISVEVGNYNFTHPNTYQLILKNESTSHSLTAISTGGGAITITEIDGITIQMDGDFFETIIFCSKVSATALAKSITESQNPLDLKIFKNRNDAIIKLKGEKFLTTELVGHLEGKNEIVNIPPVLPIPSIVNHSAPFTNVNQLLDYPQAEDLQLWELALEYECRRSGLSQEAILTEVITIVKIMRNSINEGISGTDFSDRILGSQSIKYMEKKNDGELIEAGILDRMVENISAIMEVKSSWGIIVAAPTAGSCGTLPGSVLAVADSIGSTDQDIVKAMLAAGLIGIFIINGATFSAEVGGCQAECGAASGMAAAALATLKQGSLHVALDAAAMALQNSLGMICDPIANRVEVPCLGKNIMAAGNALTCANMALAGYDVVVPLDEVIATMKIVGENLPRELCCTGLGGLSQTVASQKIKNRLKN